MSEEVKRITAADIEAAKAKTGMTLVSGEWYMLPKGAPPCGCALTVLALSLGADEARAEKADENNGEDIKEYLAAAWGYSRDYLRGVVRGFDGTARKPVYPYSMQEKTGIADGAGLRDHFDTELSREVGSE